MRKPTATTPVLKEKPKVVQKYKIVNPEEETDSQSLTQTGNFVTLTIELIYMYVFNFLYKQN